MTIMTKKISTFLASALILGTTTAAHSYTVTKEAVVGTDVVYSLLCDNNHQINISRRENGLWVSNRFMLFGLTLDTAARKACNE